MINVKIDGLYIFAAALLLVYLAMLASACPRPEFVGALIFEVSCFVVIFFWRRTKKNMAAAEAKSIIMEQLAPRALKLESWRKISDTGKTILLAVACLLMLEDLGALASAFCGQLALSKQLYLNMPISRLAGCHPAGSLELLAGAYREAGDYAKALPLFDLIRDIRLKTYGPADEMIVAIYTDFGDLYSKQKKYSLAAPYYIEAIKISRDINSPRGYGRPLTGLAETLREQGSYTAAEKAYEEALSMRERIYGPKDQRVAETLVSFAQLKKLLGETAAAKHMSDRAAEIEKNYAVPENSPFNAVILFGFSSILSYALFGKNGWLTALSIRRLEKKIDPSATIEDGDVAKLNALYNFQGLGH